MSFASNNSRNVANLLRYEALEPLNPQRRNAPVVPSINAPNPNIKPPSRQRQQIPIEDVFTPQQLDKRIPRKRTPLNNETRGATRQEDAQVESIRVRLDQIVRYYDERHNNLQSKMMVRLNQLQNFVMKEVPKIDNSNMISTDVSSLKEIIKDIRKQQQYQNNQINVIKSLTNERNSSDALQQLSKQKEKSTVLFMEMVRLGDTVQKMSEYIGTMSRGYETKYQQLENKLSNSQKNLMIMSQRTSSGSDVLNQLGDKLMSRLTTTQSNLLLLGKQQVKDKEAISKLMAQNDRLGEDLQLLLRNMQADFQSKLQNRVQQTVNRLMMEHQERIRSHQQIKKNLDLRERIASEKLMSEKMETKAKYDTMDALVRAELLKKQESIRSLHMAMQDQFRSLMTQLQAQGGRRKEQQSLFRGEIKRVQQSLRKQYDLYKNHQGQLVQKITEMIKSEIEVRLSTQIDLKKLTSSIAHQIVNDVNNLKEALSTSNKKLSFSIREVSNESAERAGQLSHYVDAEIKKVVEVVTQKYSKMKSIFTKLAEQLRNHLQNTEQNRKNVENRLTSIQQDFQKLKNEVNGEIDEFYTDLQARLKQQKQFVETVVFKKNNDLTVRVSKLQEYTNQYFELLKAGIEDNKDLLNKKITGLDQKDQAVNEEELKRLRQLVFEMKKITEDIKTENQYQFRQLRQTIGDIQRNQKEDLLALQNKIQLNIAKNVQKQKQIEEQLNQLTIKINRLTAQSNPSNNSINADRIKKLTEDFDDLNERVRSNDRTFQKITNQITVIRSEIDTLEAKIK